MKKIVATFTTIASLATTSALYAQSCPMCKESMTAAGAKLSEGFYLSIMSMFILPFAIGGTIAAMVFQSWWMRKNPESQLAFPKSFFQAVKDRKNGKY